MSSHPRTESSEPPANPAAPKRRRTGRVLLGLWVLLLIASAIVRWRLPAPSPPTGAQAFAVEQQTADGPAPGTTELHVFAQGPADAPGLLLLHGSPGSHADFGSMSALLAENYRVYAPDLPGFGVRREALPDYSPKAHARYLLDWMQQESLPALHVVGFSMGGAVALHLWELAPERLHSITLMGSIGVEELELLGDQTMNHALHGLLLAVTRAIDWGVPHFGAYDRFPINVPHARNFFDADQSEWRPLLAALDLPVLILHGENDVLVPVAAAREHARIVPQAELQVLVDQNHFLPWTATGEVAQLVDHFVARVESGAGVSRADAAPARLASAAEPFDFRSIPPAAGFALVLLVLLLALGTLASEDLTCLAAGWLVSQGRLAFVPAAFGCFLGILVGDLLLYGVGRWLGRPALERRPLSRWVKPAALHSAAGWLDRQGAKVVFLSRFTPGLRLPTYLLAGALRTRFVPFAFYFAIAAALWTPILVGLSAWLGDRFLPRDGDLSSALWRALPWILGLWLLLHQLVIPALTHAGRRGLVGKWRRWTQFEYWPTWALYGPLVPYLLWQALRFRSLTVFSAANPGMEGGGFAGESKIDILQGFGGHPAIARFVELPRLEPAHQDAPRDVTEHLACVQAWMQTCGLSYPIVIKPDAGERGKGVQIVRQAEQLAPALRRATGRHMAQEYIQGHEFGVFFERDPRGGAARITSITAKLLPLVTGDGKRTVGELVLDDARAVIMAAAYERSLGERWDHIPAPGERVRLVEVGTHSRGSIFENGAEHNTPALLAAVLPISDAFQALPGTPPGIPGLSLGRYDIKVATPEDLGAGRNLRVLELNGVTSEPTHIYDTRESLWNAWRTLAGQWRRAFELGALHRDHGVRVDRVRDLWRLARRR